MTLDLAKLAQRRADLESKLAHATAALRDAQRRDDTRRKVVAGAAFLTAVREGIIPIGTLAVLIGRMPERDAALFADAMTVPAPEFEGTGQ